MYLYTCILSLICVASVQAVQQLGDDLNYIAAVVEYHPTGKPVFDEVDATLETYGGFIKNAKAKNADIVVFPEATLNSYVGTEIRVPHGDEAANPCKMSDVYSKILTQLSCAAQFEEIYVVVNVAEKASCNKTTSEECPELGFFLFNTNVVFDRNGTIISRYRKINLFGEPGFTGSVDKELGVFDTDFGVRFGHFICFDLMFQQPAVQLLAEENVTNVVFPTMWFSELPFLTAVEIQESWAFTHNVNLLAAGANNPHRGSTGTGIYSGKRGALVAVMNSEPKSQMLVSSVPKDPKVLIPREAPHRTNSIRDHLKDNNFPAEMDSLFLKQDNLTMYASEILDIKDEQVVNLTYGEVACQFRVKMNLGLVKLTEEGDQYTYRAVAFDGVRSYTYKTGGVANCAVVACTNSSILSCAKRFPDHSTVKPTYEITDIEIIAIMPKPVYNQTVSADTIVYHPVTLDTAIMPIGITNYVFTTAELVSNSSTSKQILEMKLENGHYSDLLAFGIMGRVFNKDGQPVTGGSSVVYGFYTAYMATLFALLNYVKNRD